MFKFPIALAVGLTAAVSAAHADTIIYQGSPSFEPLIINGGDVIRRGDVAELPGLPHSILSDPAFHRLAEMCETLGVACGPDRVLADGGFDPDWTPRHIADAEKRLALLIADREDYADALEEHLDVLPLPRPHAIPRLQFGWDTPFGVPYGSPRPHVLPYDLGSLLERRHPAVPRITTPYVPDLSGFNYRLNNPAVIPHGLFPRPHLPRHTFPWRIF